MLMFTSLTRNSTQLMCHVVDLKLLMYSNQLSQLFFSIFFIQFFLLFYSFLFFFFCSFGSSFHWNNFIQAFTWMTLILFKNFRHVIYLCFFFFSYVIFFCSLLISIFSTLFFRAKLRSHFDDVFRSPSLFSLVIFCFQYFFFLIPCYKNGTKYEFLWKFICWAFIDFKINLCKRAQKPTKSGNDSTCVSVWCD